MVPGDRIALLYRGTNSSTPAQCAFSQTLLIQKLNYYSFFLSYSFLLFKKNARSYVPGVADDTGGSPLRGHSTIIKNAWPYIKQEEV